MNYKLLIIQNINDEPTHQQIQRKDVVVRLNQHTNTFSIVKNRFGDSNVTLPLELLGNVIIKPAGKFKTIWE